MSVRGLRKFWPDAAVFLVFVGFTVLLTYPQALLFATSVPEHSDPYFSMWRLGWVAHQIVRDPRHLFEANIFYPEPHTLGYSDAMLLPGVALAPLFWAGINPVAVYNLALLGAMALSGYAAFLLARRLTGSVMAGIVAGVVYGFAPYHFTHYMHLELQIVFWLPLALLVFHRIVAEGRLRDGVLLGLIVIAQAFSSVYMAVFLVTYCALFVPLLIAATPSPPYKRLCLSFVTAAAITVTAVTPYALAYAQASRVVGTRTEEDVRRYSASFSDYLSSPGINRLYGWTAVTDPVKLNEVNLFPGVAAVVLAAMGVFAARGKIRLAYFGALVFAVDLSRGVHSWVYWQLFQHVTLFRGLRSPMRIDILVNLSLAILGAYGVAWLLTTIRRPMWRSVAVAGILAVLSAEYASVPELAPAPGPSKVDSWLATQPPVVILELPVVNSGDSRDWLYMYQGMAHFQRMLNGYSGFPPRSYYEMIEAMQTFPDDRSIEYLRDRHVDYLIVRGGRYTPQEWRVLFDQLRARPDLSFTVMFSAQTLSEAVFAVKK